MNRKMLTKLRGKYVGIRPIARRFHLDGHELGVFDDNWLVTESTRDRITIQAVVAKHILTLDADHIHEFRSASSPAPRSGMLVLNSQVFLKGMDAWVEPLTRHQDDKFLAPTQDRRSTSVQNEPTLSAWQIVLIALGVAAAYALVSGQ